MSEKKHIDRLFQEKFKDFEVSPNKSVWKNIEKELKSKKRKKFLLPLWYKIAGAAAVLVLLFLAGNFVFNNFGEIPVVKSNPAEKAIEPSKEILGKEIEVGRAIVSEENSEEKMLSGKKTNNNSISTNSGKERSNSAANTKLKEKRILNETGNAENNSVVSNVEKLPVIKEKNSFLKKSTQTDKENKIVGKISDYKNSSDSKENDASKVENASENENLLPQNKVLNTPAVAKTNIKNDATETILNENGSQTEEPQKSLLEIAAQQEEDEIFEKEEKTELASNANWQISPFAAPIYYGGFGSQNAIDPSLAQNKSESEMTMSYGVNFSYKISERLKIRSGVAQVSMAYNTHDIAFATAVKPSSFNNVAYSSSVTDNLEIVPLNSVQSQNSELLGRSPFTAGTLHQQIGFIEVPLEIEYALIDKKIGLSIIGGASTLFLNNNSLVINSENGTTNIGEMKNLNDLSFSTNIGLGLDYKISKQFEIKLEPTFKYQINSFSGNDNGFKPYYFGIYTGIGFKF
ncbi:MAG TPA: hypothetical protein VFM82_07000 [Flavobacteriaceae bacterium]|nr:hypothetical protein [Flavobacteriaceae bacterium]